MSFFQSIILGIIQGLTEFLPVSSSGHLALAQALFKDFEQPGLLYDTLLHLATLLAVTVFFRKRIMRLFKAFFGLFFIKYRLIYHEERGMLWGIIAATIPTGIIGYLLKDMSELLFEKPIVIGYFLILTSVMLILADRATKGGPVNPRKAFIVGIAQGLAVFPGISRSGTTIFAGMMVGISREKAAEFSFLISIPAIIGAMLLQFKHLGTLTSSEITVYLAGMGTAFFFGILAIGVMMEIVKKAKMRYFALYCLIIGICAVVFL